MRKNLKSMANHLRSLILPETREAYEIKLVFKDISSDANIREGVLAFRAFLLRFCDVLEQNSDLYDKPKKMGKEHLSAIFYNFPFLDNAKKLLLNIGLTGELTTDAAAIIAAGTIFYDNLSDTKNMECLRFLIDCGMIFTGIDPDNKKQKLSEIQRIEISYPDNPAMLIGLKTMAIAEAEFGTNFYRNILMRCDYRVISTDEMDMLVVLKETILPLSPKIQNFVLRLHQLHLDKGLNCDVEIRGFWKKIKYSRGKKEIWGINTSLNCGYDLTVKAVNTEKYTDAMLAFPVALQELISKGYGCGRKREHIGICDSGCEGLHIPLDDLVLEISDGIEAWLAHESTSSQKNKQKSKEAKNV
ncbi:MAG: hypothetical protein FWC73_07680 [Defluviitaleaceae bacterium]|nr:hypothetical protein [Defluviitaleaceae bacterium]